MFRSLKWVAAGILTSYSAVIAQQTWNGPQFTVPNGFQVRPGLEPNGSIATLGQQMWNGSKIIVGSRLQGSPSLEPRGSIAALGEQMWNGSRPTFGNRIKGRLGLMPGGPITDTGPIWNNPGPDDGPVVATGNPIPQMPCIGGPAIDCAPPKPDDPLTLQEIQSILQPAERPWNRIYKAQQLQISHRQCRPNELCIAGAAQKTAVDTDDPPEPKPTPAPKDYDNCIMECASSYDGDSSCPTSHPASACHVELIKCTNKC